MTTGLSPSERIEGLTSCAHKFNQHLLETPGVVLSAELRWAVAVVARDALTKCKGWYVLSQLP